MYSADMFMNDVDELLDKIRKEGNYKITIPAEKVAKSSRKQLENCIQRVKFDNPWTIVWWNDGSITRVKCCEQDIFTEECGLIAAICKHYFDDTDALPKVLEKWCNSTSKYCQTVDIDAAHDTGYNDGYTAGYEDGESDGRLAGHDEGWVLGYNTGYEQGYSDGKTL